MSFCFFSKRNRIAVEPPPSTEKTIIFPYNEHTGRFITNFYKQKMTSGRLQSIELIQYLAYIEAQLASWNQTALGNFIRKIRVLIFVMILLSIAGIPITILHLVIEYNGIPLFLPVVGGMLILSIFLFFVCSCKFNSKRANTIDQVMANVRSYVKQNSNLFHERSLTWTIPTHFPKWIELCKDDVLNTQLTETEILTTRTNSSDARFFHTETTSPTILTNQVKSQHYKSVWQQSPMVPDIQVSSTTDDLTRLRQQRVQTIRRSIRNIPMQVVNQNQHQGLSGFHSSRNDHNQGLNC